MRLLLYILITLLSHHTYAQSLQVNYESLYDGTIYTNQLTINDSVSVWDIIPGKDAADNVDELLIKNLADSSVTLLDYIFQKKFYVKDTLHPMRWELLPDNKIIQGYSCSAAKTFFRGRMYMAYYAKDIMHSGGPWKFGGLPGLILEVLSMDEVYHFRAMHIQKGNDIYLSDYDLHENEQISWPEYCRQVIHKISQYVHYMQSVSNNPGSQVNLRIERPEIIYPLAQSTAGISSE